MADNENLVSDNEYLFRFPKEKLIELLLYHIKNLWRVDGLYFLGIEDRHGIESATYIDKEVWRILAKIEARDLKRILNIQDVENISSFIELLRNTSWALYQEDKEILVDSIKGVAIFRVIKCKVQEARIRKGFGVFPCKPVRQGYLEEFIKEVNPKIKLYVSNCPPERRRQGYWCQWRFKLTK
jgi:hypothetical protein